MAEFDIEAIRAEVRALPYIRGTPAEVEQWRIAHEDSRANLVIEDMIPTPNEDAFFAMLLEEGVSPELGVQIMLKLYGFPHADPALPVTPRFVVGGLATIAS